MTSRLNSDIASQFPLAIPTRSKAPAARLVLRGQDGLALKQWLIKTAKCTLGSDPECTLRCDLPGIARYHVLIVVGARQTFLRALAPKLTRDGIAVNELLLTGEANSFEIAGHQFELSRQDTTGQLPAPGNPQARMRFALNSPLQTRTRAAGGSQTAAKVIADGEHNDLLPAGSDTATPRWVARIVRDAVLPLETQLREVMQPIAELQSQVEREKRRRKAEEEQRRDLENREPEIDAATVQSVVKEQVEAITARQAGAMDVITERISDVNHQLSSIERIVAAERESQPAELESRVTEEIEAQSQSIQKLQEGFVAVATALSDLQASQRTAAETESEWKSDVQAKLDALQHAVENMRGQSAEVAELSDQEREQIVSELQKAQSAFNVAAQPAEELSSVELAEQTLTNEWSLSELASVVDSDKVEVPAYSVPFAALDNSLQTSEAKTAPEEDVSEAASQPEQATSSAFDEREDWDQEAEIESIELYGPSGSDASPSASAGMDETPPSQDLNWTEDDAAQDDAGKDEDDFATEGQAVAAPQIADDPVSNVDAAVGEDSQVPFVDLAVPAAQHPFPAEGPQSENDSGRDTPELPSQDEHSEASEVAALGDYFESDAVEPPSPSAEGAEPAFPNAAPHEAYDFGAPKSDELIAEEQASLPSWWDEANTDSSNSPFESDSVPDQEIAASGFNDPEFATSADNTAHESPLGDPNLVSGEIGDSVTRENGAADCAVDAWAEEPPSPDSEIEPVEMAPEANVIAAVIDASEEEEFPTAAEFDLLGEPAAAANDSSESALKLIDDLSEATKAANDDGPISELTEQDEFPTAAAIDESAVVGPTLEGPVPGSPSPSEENATPQPEVKLPGEQARGNSNDSFPTIETMANREASSIFALENRVEAQSPDSLLRDFPEKEEDVAQETPVGSMPSDATSPGADSDVEDESVEDYMRRLLARMRGEAEPEDASPSPPSNPDLAISAPSQMIQEAQADAPDPISHAENQPEVSDAGVAPVAPEAPVAIEPETDSGSDSGLTAEQIKLLQQKEDESRANARRASAPELEGKLEAMRELANSTARSAIGKSNRRRVLSSLALKASISAIGMAVAAALIAINGLALNIGLIATCAALLVAAIWGWDALTTLRHFKQVPAEKPNVAGEDE